MMQPIGVQPLFPSGPSASPAVNDMLRSTTMLAFNEEPLDIRATDYKMQIEARVDALMRARGPDPTMPLPLMAEPNPVMDSMRFEAERQKIPGADTIPDIVGMKRNFDFELERISTYAQQKRDHYALYETPKPAGRLNPLATQEDEPLWKRDLTKSLFPETSSEAVDILSTIRKNLYGKKI